MRILVLFGMYFDAVVVFVNRHHFYSDWIWPYCGKRLFYTSFFRCQIPEKVQFFEKKFKVVQEITGYCLALICLFLFVSTTYANGGNLGYDFS